MRTFKVHSTTEVLWLCSVFLQVSCTCCKKNIDVTLNWSKNPWSVFLLNKAKATIISNPSSSSYSAFILLQGCTSACLHLLLFLWQYASNTYLRTKCWWSAGDCGNKSALWGAKQSEALTARAAYTVWFTAHESTYPLAHRAAKVMEKVKKMLGKCLQLKNESIKPNQSAIILFLLAIWSAKSGERPGGRGF